MPKRPNPSTNEEEKDEAKKPRADDSVPNGDEPRADAKQPAAVRPDAGAGRAVGAASKVVAAVLPKAGAIPNATASSTPRSPPAPSSNNGSSGGSKSNSFLKSLRTRNSAINSNGDESKKPPSADGTTAPVKIEPLLDSVTNGGIPSATLSVVPFPHLPLENESRLKSMMVPFVVFLLFLLNISAATYVLYQRSWHSAIHFRSSSELNKLQDELASSLDEVTILRQRMNALEQAREAKEEMLADNTEVFAGLFGPAVAGGGEDLLTREERNEWVERLKMLEAGGQDAKNEFNKNLLGFEADRVR